MGRKEEGEQDGQEILGGGWCIAVPDDRVRFLGGGASRQTGGLVITQSFASKEINTGGTWKVYLNASNPDGEMVNIYATVDQPGVGQYPSSIMKLKKRTGKNSRDSSTCPPPALPVRSTDFPHPDHSNSG